MPRLGFLSALSTTALLLSAGHAKDSQEWNKEFDIPNERLVKLIYRDLADAPETWGYEPNYFNASGGGLCGVDGTPLCGPGNWQYLPESAACNPPEGVYDQTPININTTDLLPASEEPGAT